VIGIRPGENGERGHGLPNLGRCLSNMGAATVRMTSREAHLASKSRTAREALFMLRAAMPGNFAGTRLHDACVSRARAEARHRQDPVSVQDAQLMPGSTSGEALDWLAQRRHGASWPSNLIGRGPSGSYSLWPSRRTSWAVGNWRSASQELPQPLFRCSGHHIAARATPCSRDDPA
jgi:hypothetical protein